MLGRHILANILGPITVMTTVALGWAMLIVTSLIMFTILAINPVGDGLRDAIDPRLEIRWGELGRRPVMSTPGAARPERPDRQELAAARCTSVVLAG